MSIIENARGHAIRAAIIALMLTIATQVGADDAELNPDEWTFLECKYAEGWPRKIMTGENSPIPFLLAISKDKTSVIEMENDWHFNDCRAFRHSYLECSGNSTKYNISINRYTAEMFLTLKTDRLNMGAYLCEKLDGPSF